MALNMLQRVLVVCLLAALTAAFCVAQEHSGIVGKWNMTSETNGDPVHWTFVVKEADGKLAGFLTVDEGEVPAKDFSYQSGVVKFKAPYQGQDYDVELKLNGNTLEGTWSGGGDSGRTSGTKAQ